MNGTVPFLKVSGIPVRLHFTLLMLVGFVAFSSEENIFRDSILLVAIFASILLHEFGHAFAARIYKIRTLHIVMYFIGGIARLDRQPEARQALWISIAGPCVNLLLAALLWVGLQLMGNNELVGEIAAANLLIGTFNLLPAFPLDGGRILNSLLSFHYAELEAARWVSVTGRVFAIGIGALAIWQEQWLLAAVALFLFFTSRREYFAVKTNSLLKGVRVSEIMLRNFVTLQHGVSIREAAELLLDSSQQDFPVVHGGLVVGLLTRDNLLNELANEGPEAYVSGAMDRNFMRLEPGAVLENQITNLSGNEYRALVMQEDQLLGIITQDNFNEFLVLRNLGLRRRAA